MRNIIEGSVLILKGRCPYRFYVNIVTIFKETERQNLDRFKLAQNTIHFPTVLNTEINLSVLQNENNFFTPCKTLTFPRSTQFHAITFICTFTFIKERFFGGEGEGE